MKLQNLPADCRTDKSALPLFFPGRNDEAVLVIHGYTGITARCGTSRSACRRRAGPSRFPGFPATVPDRRISFPPEPATGFAGRRTNFSTSGQVLRVHVVGLSMGPPRDPDRLPVRAGKVVLAAPAVVNNDKRILLTPIWKFFRKAIPKKDYLFDGPASIPASPPSTGTGIGPPRPRNCCRSRGRRAARWETSNRTCSSSCRRRTVPCLSRRRTSSRPGRAAEHRADNPEGQRSCRLERCGEGKRADGSSPG